MAQIEVIKYSRELQSQLFPDNEFYKNSIVEADLVDVAMASVEIPIAGSIGAAKSGNPSLPLTPAARVDDKNSYAVDLLYCDPVIVRKNQDINMLSYNKLQDVVRAQAGALNTRAADIAATNWATTTAAQIIRTSSTSTRNVAITGATGTRKRATKEDFIKILTIFNRMNLPSRGFMNMFGLLTPDHVEDLFLIPEFVDADKTGELSKLRNGEIANILGFTLRMRTNDLGTSGVLFDTAAAKKALGAAVAATDCAGSIFWHRDLVRHAEGYADVTIDGPRADYLGGKLVTSTVRFGATISRTDQKGVAALVDAN